MSGYADYDQWEADQERRLRHHPECAWCGAKIVEVAYRIGNDLVCSDCIDEAMVIIED